MKLPRATGMALVQSAHGGGTALEAAARAVHGGGRGGDSEDVFVLEDMFVPRDGVEGNVGNNVLGNNVWGNNVWDSYRDPTGAPRGPAGGVALALGQPASARPVLYGNARLPSAHLWLSSAQLLPSPPPLTPAERMGVAPSVDECLDLAEGGVLLVCTHPPLSFSHSSLPLARTPARLHTASLSLSLSLPSLLCLSTFTREHALAHARTQTLHLNVERQELQEMGGEAAVSDSVTKELMIAAQVPQASLL